MTTAAPQSINGFFAELKEIEDVYHLEVLKLRRRQRGALRRLEIEAERQDVEKMKQRVEKRYGAGT